MAPLLKVDIHSKIVSMTLRKYNFHRTNKLLVTVPLMVKAPLPRELYSPMESEIQLQKMAVEPNIE